MSANLPPELKRTMTANLEQLFEQMATQHPQYDELLSLWQQLHTVYLESTAEVLQHWAEKFGAQNLPDNNLPEKIEAHSVVIEVVDNHTGTCFRRNVPLEYVETDNGISLSGETMDGKSTQIVFLSDTALTKINDLMGRGPDKPRCNHEE